MAGTPCPACGTVNPPGYPNCLRCGGWLPQVVGAPGAPLPGAPPPPPGYAASPPVAGIPPPGYGAVPGPPFGGWGTPPRHFSPEVDGRALGRGEIAGIIGFLVGLIGPALFFLIGPSVSTSLGPTSSVTSGVASSTLALWTAVSLLDAGLTLVSWMLMRAAFVALRPVDADFSTPPTLVIIGAFGVVLAAVALPFFLVGVNQILQCDAQNLNQTAGGSAACLVQNGGAFTAAAGVLVIGAVIALIGYIGLVLGIWRLGTRYDVSLLHIGAILAIFLPFIGWLLIWLGCREARRKVPASSPYTLGTPKV